MSPESTSSAPWHDDDEPEWLTRVRASFTRHLPPRMEAVEAARAELDEAGRLGDETRAELFRSAHNIAGTAGVLGGDRLGAIAGAVARMVDLPRAVDEDPGKDAGPGASGDLSEMLEEFEAAAAEFLIWTR